MTNLIIIDDEVKLRGLLKRILELEGYHVSEAGDARSAFPILEKEDIQAVICDVKLPDAHRVELTKQVSRSWSLFYSLLTSRLLTEYKP